MNHFCIQLVSLLCVFGAAILSGPPSAAGEATVAELREQGWRVVEKTSHQEKHPGIAPYENLTRVLQVSTFVLAFNGKRQTCRMVYDSQRDNLSETCVPEATAK